MFKKDSSAGTAAQKSSKSSWLIRSALILAIPMLSVVFCQAQITFNNGSSLFNLNDCGTWKANPDYYTDWEGVDTLKSNPIKDTIRKWIYSDEKMQVSNMTTLEYAPCGNGRPTTWEQFRICEITGIRQVRYRVRTYKYIPKPKSEYQKALDSLSGNHR